MPGPLQGGGQGDGYGTSRARWLCGVVLGQSARRTLRVHPWDGASGCVFPNSTNPACLSRAGGIATPLALRLRLRQEWEADSEAPLSVPVPNAEGLRCAALPNASRRRRVAAGNGQSPGAKGMLGVRRDVRTMADTTARSCRSGRLGSRPVNNRPSDGARACPPSTTPPRRERVRSSTGTSTRSSPVATSVGPLLPTGRRRRHVTQPVAQPKRGSNQVPEESRGSRGLLDNVRRVGDLVNLRIPCQTGQLVQAVTGPFLVDDAADLFGVAALGPSCDRPTR